MSARAAEADVLVRLAQDVEAVRIREHRLVAVAELYQSTIFSPARSLLTAELGVLRAGAPEVDHRRRPAHDLLDRGRRQPSKSAAHLRRSSG